MALKLCAAYGAVQFAVLRASQRMIQRSRKRETLNDTDNIIVGALTGAITSIVTEPLDVARTRLMTQRALSTNSAQLAGKTIYKGWLNCLQTIAKEEGALALWKGGNLRLLWVGVGSALWFSTYEAAKRSIVNGKQISDQRLESTKEAKDFETKVRPLSVH